jgi:uncharacterized protein
MRSATRALAPDPLAATVADVLEDGDLGLGPVERELLAWTEGLLTAAAIGPELTYPHEWMHAVFGTDHVFEDIEQAQAAIAMLALMHNKILDDLQGMGAEYAPVFLDDAEDGDVIAVAEQWADGFLAGLRLRAEAWRPLLDSEQGLSLVPIFAFLTDGDGNARMFEAPAEKVAKARQEALAFLGLGVFEVSEYWRVHAKRPEPASVAPFRKVGRNEPCPCGSGKKYKKCCLDRPA